VTRTLAIAVLAALAAVQAVAEEKPIALRPARGVDKVEANCSGCHSLDYISMNSPFPTAALWDATVAKMIKAFGAPLDDGDAKIVADYLKKNYGN
jgi:sulfite dehydrogenase (cytochrome) subunit B